MKKITIYVVLALLCLNFTAKAQENKAVDVTAKGIQIGQKLPDITIIGLHNYKDANGKPATTAKISDFKGKLLILDFWATWCSPCVAMIPKMDSLQKFFGDKIQFLSVTYQTEKEVLPFLEKFEKQRGKHYDLPVVTADKELHQLFPHVYLPHYVWIDGKGIIKAITEYKEVNAVGIQKALSDQIDFEQKKDMKIAYDKNKPFLINGNGGNGTNLLYHSIITGYTEGLPSAYNFSSYRVGENRRITTTNNSILQLFKVAFGGDRYYYGLNKTIIETEDKASLNVELSGQEYLKWLRNGNSYCYELIVPTNLAHNIFEVMQEDLRRIFSQYKVNIETRKVKSLVLKRTSNQTKFLSTTSKVENIFTGMGSKMRNSTFNTLIMRLNVLYMQKLPYPVVNGTGFTGKIDLDLNANLSNLIEVNRELVKYDLELVLEDYETDMLIIRDNIIGQTKVQLK